MRIVLLVALLFGCRDKASPAAPPAIAIALHYAGADAATIEASVVEPVERAVNGIAGVRTIESRIEADRATVMLELASPAELERALHDTRHALSSVQPVLPADVDVPTITRATRDEPVMWLAVRGTLPLVELSAYGRDVVRRRLERRNGVAHVELHGFAERTVIVRPDLDRVAASGLTMFDVLAALQSIEIGQVTTLEELVVKQVGDALVRLRDIATVEDGFERAAGVAEPTLAIRAQYGADKAQVVHDLREELSTLDLPPGVKLIETPSPIPVRPAAPLAVTVRGPDLDELRAIADAYVSRLQTAGVTDVVRDPPEGEREQAVVPDRTRAAELGIPIADIVATLRVVSGTTAGQIVVDKGPRPLVVKLPAMGLPEVLSRVHVRDRRGSLVPLSALVSVTETRSHAILRLNGERAIALAIYAPEAARSAARRAIADRALPAGYRATIVP